VKKQRAASNKRPTGPGTTGNSEGRRTAELRLGRGRGAAAEDKKLKFEKQKTENRHELNEFKFV
jgi:hypothetical protein